MKVLIANKFFFRNGGSEVVMFQERDYLKKNGVEVLDFSMFDKRNLESRYSSYFVSHQSYGENGQGTAGRLLSAFRFIYSPEAVKKIGEAIDEEQPDIVHCHNIYHQLTPSIIAAAKRRHIPVVLTLHDYKTVCPVYTRLRNGQACSDCLDMNFTNVLKHRCADNSLSKSVLLFAEAVVQKMLGNYEKVDMLLAPSQFMADSVTQHRFPKERVRLLYNGIDVDSINPPDTDRNYILYMGRLSPEKGAQTLLDAHSMLNIPAELVIAGTGPLEKSLRERYPKARFVGHVTGQTLHQILQDAAMVVVPSEWYENCPMSVLEAMAYGKPVIASNIGGIPELVADGETGLLFNPGNKQALRDCLSALVGDVALRRRYGTAGRKRVESHFSLDNHNKRLFQAYTSLVQVRDTAG